MRRTIVAVICACALVAAACGDGADPAPTATPAGTATRAAATNQPGDFGPAPRLGDNITKISPPHASRVTQKSTQSPNADRPGGVCAEVNFEGLPENTQWFRMAIGQDEVTTQLVWVVPDASEPKEGKMCYAPEAGLPVGRHTAAISVQDPRDPSQPTKQVVAWEFEVTP
jgi:hypothetical protein